MLEISAIASVSCTVLIITCFDYSLFLTHPPETGFMHRLFAAQTWPYGRPVTHQT